MIILQYLLDVLIYPLPPKKLTASMARKQKADSFIGSQANPMPSQLTARRRATLRELHFAAVGGQVSVPKIINAAPYLEKAEMFGIDDERPTSSKVMALLGRIFIETIPQWLTVAAMLGLIFGGCCSNVSWRLPNNFNKAFPNLSLML